MNRFRSLGSQVTAEGVSLECLTAVRAFWEDAPERLLANDRQVHLRPGPLPLCPEEAQPETLALIEQTVTVRRYGNELWLPGLHLQVHSTGATLIFTPEAMLPASLEFWSLAFTEAHRASGWLPLHAAVFANHGRAAALTGVSGAGKSTATLRLMEQGYTVLAEDRAFWHVTGKVAGLDRWLRAFPDSVERFAPRLLPTALRGPRDVKGKLLLPLPEAKGSAELFSLLLLSDVPELTLSERVRLLWETTGVPLTTLARQEVQRGIGKLLPLFSPQPVQRSDVPERIKAILGETDT